MIAGKKRIAAALPVAIDPDSWFGPANNSQQDLGCFLSRRDSILVSAYDVVLKSHECPARNLMDIKMTHNKQETPYTLQLHEPQRVV